MKKLATIIVAGLTTLTTSWAVAEDRRTIGTFGDWKAHTAGETDQRICWISSEPKKDEGDYKKRGRIHAVIGHHLGDKSFHLVQFTAGYMFRKDSEVKVTIGKLEFDLFTSRDTAWTRDAESDRNLAGAMRAGNEMIVVGYSSRGTETRDTYSLKGFTAAHDAINKACGLDPWKP